MKIKFGQKKPRLRIVLIVIACLVGVLLIAAGVLAGIFWAKAQTKGRISLPGSYAPEAESEYVVREYTDYFSGSTTQKFSTFDPEEETPTAVYELYNALGRRMPEFCGEWDGVTDPETLRADKLAAFQEKWLYSDEAMEEVTFFLYQPTETYRFAAVGAEVTEETISVTLRMIPGEGDPQLMTMSGTYQIEGEQGTAVFSDSEIPLSVVSFFQSFQYAWYIDNSNYYVNCLTFNDTILMVCS